MDEKHKLTNALKAVTEAVVQGEAEVEAAQVTFKDCETRVRERIKALVLDVAQKAYALNSQVVLQQAVRSLYWGAWVKAGVISEAFGLKEQAVHSIAGPLVEQTPCEGGCGKEIESTYRSHSDWRTTSRARRRITRLCKECKAEQDVLGRVEYQRREEQRRKEAEAYCAENGHHWGAEDINGKRAENGVDWISNNRPIHLENANLVSIDTNAIVLQLFCMNWCGATMEKRISALSTDPADASLVPQS